MQKLAPFSLLLVLAFGGCQMLKRSGPWDTVTTLRVEIPAGSDPSSAYAEELHRALQRDGVPHRVVTFSYLDSQRFEAPAGSRTVVIYEDHSSMGSPFWLMDDQLSRPLWLPNADLEAQLRFYIRGKQVQGITSKPYLTADASTEMPQVKQSVAFRHGTPLPESRPTFNRPANDEATPARPMNSDRPAKRKSPKPSPRPQPEAMSEHKAVVPEVRGEKSHTPNDELFRRKHGTAFNPASAMDRRKMEKLKKPRH